ncbi:MAG TPA: ABC transporter ATP-binding protein [Magnetospirillaceae bacterium]|nr:ABC transporter ATP-binding protein [Magnetospirillaceae bacterium]
MPKKQKKLSNKEYLSAIAGVAKLSFKMAPLAVSFKLVGAVIDAVLPIAITFFAALTTTELVAAYSGDSAAGQRAVWYVVITALIGLASTAWRSLDQYVQQLMRFKVEARVSDMMYEHFLSLEFWRYDDKETADLYDRAQKFSQFFAYVFDRLAGVFTQVITLVFTLIALFLFMPWLAFFVLIAVVPGVFIQFKLSRAQVEHWNKNVDVRRSRSYIEWNLLQPQAIAELRLNGLVRHLLNLRRSLRDRDEKTRLQFERNFIGKRLLADTLESATEVGALIWVISEIIAKTQPIGQFVYVQQLVSRAINAANAFVSQVSSIDEDLANLFDYQAFMKLPSQKGGNAALGQSPEVIKISNVSFKYPQSKMEVLQDITLSIFKGQHVAIVGENGAGKTTLIKVLTGLYEPTRGAITIDGVPLSDIAVEVWHNKLSVLQQDFQQFVFTDIQNNVYFGDTSQPINKARIERALHQAEAYNFVHKLPHKLQTYPTPWMEDEDGNKGTGLSGGQWQRIALARNFYRNAPIIILDEPTSAIDAIAEARIFKRLFDAENKKTVITISHRMSTVEKADVIVVLQHGRIAETGTHAELVKKKSAYYTMFEAQLTEK